MFKHFKKNKGIITLPTVIVIGLMTLAVVVSITSMAFNELLTSQGGVQSSLALSYAEAGARDALMRIARDKNYICDGIDCYSICFVENGCNNNNGLASITVDESGATSRIVTSYGYSGSSIRVMQVVVTLDNGTTDASLQKGEITATAWSEITN